MVFSVSSNGIISKFIESAVGKRTASVAGTGRTIPAGTGKGTEIRAGGSAAAAMAAFSVGITFQCEIAFVGKDAVELDFLAYGGLILANGSGNSRFGGAIAYAGSNDLAVVKCKSLVFVVIHDKSNLLCKIKMM